MCEQTPEIRSLHQYAPDSWSPVPMHRHLPTESFQQKSHLHLLDINHSLPRLEHSVRVTDGRNQAFKTTTPTLPRAQAPFTSRRKPTFGINAGKISRCILQMYPQDSIHLMEAKRVSFWHLSGQLISVYLLSFWNSVVLCFVLFTMEVY